MEQAIIRAIEGGYPKENTESPIIQAGDSMEQFVADAMNKFYKVKTLYPKILLDPLFWQALGKVERWNSMQVNAHGGREYHEWLYQWHKFIEHIAEGKDIDSFFTNLLQSNEK